MEKDELYLILAKIQLLINEYNKTDKNVVDYVTKTEKIMKELRAILKEIEIPSKYLIAEGFEDLYKEIKKNETKN